MIAVKLHSALTRKDFSFIQSFSKQFQLRKEFVNYVQLLPCMYQNVNKYFMVPVYGQMVASQRRQMFVLWNVRALKRYQSSKSGPCKDSSSSSRHNEANPPPSGTTVHSSAPASIQCMLGERQFGSHYLWHLPEEGLLLWAQRNAKGAWVVSQTFQLQSLNKLYSVESVVQTSWTL